jgi:hypothetical protein
MASARRLGEHRIAGGERRRDLAGEDRQREIPRGDARERAAAPELDGVGLARRPSERDRTGEQPARLRSVVAQEIDSLAHIGKRVLQGLAGFAHHHRHQVHAVALVDVGGRLQDRRPRRTSEPVPGVRDLGCSRNGVLDLSGIGGVHGADALAAIVRAQNGCARACRGLSLAVDEGHGDERGFERRVDVRRERPPHAGLVQRHAPAVAALGQETRPAVAGAAMGRRLPLGLHRATGS